MKLRIPINLILLFCVMVFLRCPVAASAAEAVVNGTGNVVPPAAEHDSSEHHAATEQITLSASRPTATTSLRSAPVLISAVLKRAENPVPDGTVVDFAISSGIGNLGGTTTTVSGIATVKLSSTTPGTVIVSAKSGAASADISTLFLDQPQQAIVKVATVGAPASSPLIGGLLASITFPISGYVIAPGGVSPSGVSSGATTTLSASIGTAGQVILALLDANGIPIGEFATLTFQVTDGFLPHINDFKVAPNTSVVAPVSNSAIPGVGIAVLSLTLR